MADAETPPETEKTEKPAPDAAPAADDGRFVTVTLAEPIKRGEMTIDKVTLRKPRAGELRGLALPDLINTDINAVLKVIPRITDPVLTPEDAANLGPVDLAEIGGSIRGFFMSAAEKEMMQAMIAAQMQKI